MKNCSFSAALNIFDLKKVPKKNNDNRVELNGKKRKYCKKRRKLNWKKTWAKVFTIVCVFSSLFLSLSISLFFLFHLRSSLPFSFSLFAHVSLVQSFIFSSEICTNVRVFIPLFLAPQKLEKIGTGKRKHCHYKHDVWN